MSFPAIFDLKNLNGSNGFAINGINVGNQTGHSVSGAGDINGDGIADIIIGTPLANNKAGQSFVIFGKNTGFPSAISLNSINGTNGFTINGVSAGDQSGYSVSGAGDVNGDGIDDVIIGAPFAYRPYGNTGEGYVVFGSSTGFPATISLTDLTGKNGFIMNDLYELGNNAAIGYSVSGAGDVNGDGIDDVIIGAPFKDNRGVGYVILGKAATFAASISLINLNGANGFRLLEATGSLCDSPSDSLGYSVSSAGDVNGDGIDDIIISDPNTNSYEGETFIIFGKKSGFSSSIYLCDLYRDGFAITSDDISKSFTGYSVSGAGDVNGDGIDDVIINGNKGQSNWVLFGSKTFPTTVYLNSLNGQNGFTITGNAYLKHVSNAGDVNGDGIADVIIGGRNSLTDKGQAYVLFGSKNFPATVYLDNLNGVNGFKVNGIYQSYGDGFSVSGSGDVNGDGIDDVIIGDYSFNNYTGQSYVIFGQFAPIPSPSPSPSPSHTPANDFHSDDTGAIIGGVIGSIAGLAVLGVIGWAYNKGYFTHGFGGETQSLIGDHHGTGYDATSHT